MNNRITSVQNEYIKQLVRLNSSSGRKAANQFLVEGPKLCAEVLRSGWDVDCCLITDAMACSFDLSSFKGDVIYITDSVAKKLSTLDTTPGIFMVVEQKKIFADAHPRFILALDHISDPSNLGAILRSAEAFGVDLLYLSEGSVDLFSPKVLRGAMGSLFRCPVEKGNLSDFLIQKKEEGYQIIGAGLDRNYLNLPALTFDSPTVIVIGNEANGISEKIINLCDRGVFIPMVGKNESLNAAVAASIILWEQSKWK